MMTSQLKCPQCSNIQSYEFATVQDEIVERITQDIFNASVAKW